MKVKSMRRSKRTEAVTAYLMLLPNLLGLFIFSFIAIIYAFYISLHNWNGLSEMVFVGLRNYLLVFQNSDFWDSFLVTLQYAVMFVPAIFFASLLLALFVQSVKGRMQQFFRVVFFLPHAVSIVIAGIIWSFMYDHKSGYINNFLQLFGIARQKFTYNPNQALFSVVIVALWLSIGFYMLMFLSALKEIPPSYYEAAEIDGANALRKFIHITFPLLRDTSLFILIVSTIGAFQSFDIIMVMTGGGPVSTTTVTVLYIYKQAFELSKFGYASAASFLLFFFILAMTLLQFKVLSPKEEAP